MCDLSTLWREAKAKVTGSSRIYSAQKFVYSCFGSEAATLFGLIRLNIRHDI